MHLEGGRALRGRCGIRFGVGMADVDPENALRVLRLGWFNGADEPEVCVIGMFDEIVDRVRMVSVVVEPSEFAISSSVEENYFHPGHDSEDRSVSCASGPE